MKKIFILLKPYTPYAKATAVTAIMYNKSIKIDTSISDKVSYILI